MKKEHKEIFREVALPWSEGMLSARLWMVGKRTVVGVPELGLHCYGSSQSEAVFRLFTTLLKYYRQLKAHPKRLSQRGLNHLELLRGWVSHIENRMTASPAQTERSVVQLVRR
jgi:hypothetical protein